MVLPLLVAVPCVPQGQMGAHSHALGVVCQGGAAGAGAAAVGVPRVVGAPGAAGGAGVS